MTKPATFDAAAIGAIRDTGGDALLRRLVELFLAHTPERMRQITAAWESRDLASLALAAHALRSTAGAMGAVHVHRASEDLEDAARAGDAERAGRACQRLDEAWQSACREITGLLPA